MDANPYRALAAAVLIRAVKDAYGRRPSVSNEARADAWRFLRKSPELVFWCDVLDYDVDEFCEAVLKNGFKWATSRYINQEAG